MNEDTLIEFSITPVGDSSDSMSPVIAKVADRVRGSGMPNEVHAMGTVVEGQLDDCLDLLKQCLREAMEDKSRLTATVRLDLRPGHSGRIKGSVESVAEKLGQD